MSILKVNQIQTANGVIMANLNSSGANIGFQLASSLAPAFKAYRAADQSISNSTDTKVQLNTEVFDTNNNFDSTTNYRFTPTVAGYYQFSAILNLGGTPVTNAQAHIWKNGVKAAQFVFYEPSGTTQYQINASLSDLIYMNGSTDYVELYGYISAGSGNQFGGGSTQAFLAGYLARSA